MQLRPKMFVAVAIAFLMFSLLDGIFRLMAVNGLNTGIMENIYGLHPILMVFGFLASIVMAERVAGISVIPELKKSKVPFVMVPLIAFGVVSELIGYTVGPGYLANLGSVLLLAGSLVFVFVLFKLSKRTGMKLPFYFMICSAISLGAAAVLSGFSLPAGNFGFIMLLLSFPLVFILGERVELTRFTSTPSASKRFKLAFLFSCAAVLSFILASVPNLFRAQLIGSSLGSLFLLATLLLVLLAENQNWKLLSRSKEPLQKYVVAHTRVAYAWGIIGVVLAEVYFADSTRVDLYDPFIHAIAIGFIGTMLLAHGPVILPSVTGKKLDVSKISLLPLGVLTAGNLIRVFGDLSFILYNSATLETIIGLSGWLILISVIIFLRQVLFASGNRQKIAEPRNVSSTQ